MDTHYEEMMKSQPYLPFNMGGRLTRALIEKAEKELGETEEVKAKTIPELRRLVQAEEGLICPTDDPYLLMYLRARKFDVKKAYSLLKNFYTVKKSNEDIYGSFDREALTRAMNQKAGFDLPYRDEEGCVVGVIRMWKWDVDATNGSEIIAYMTAVVLMVALEPATQICGARVLCDVRGTTLKQIRCLIPRQVYLLARAFTNTLPLRFKGFHIYNESPIFPYMLSVMKLLMTEKMRNRFHMHGNNQKHLHKYIPKAILPAEDYGGDMPGDVAAWFNESEMRNCFELYRQMITSYGYKH